MARLFVPLLLVLTLLGPGAALAEKGAFLHGEISAVDTSSRRLTLRTVPTDGEVVREVEVELPNRGKRQDSSDVLSGCIVVGRHIRVWGEGTEGGALFRAAEVRGCNRAACEDPTGVRARLYRHRGEQQGSMCQ